MGGVMSNGGDMATEVEWKEEWDSYLDHLEEDSEKNKKKLASWLSVKQPEGAKIKRSYVVLENLSMWTVRILAKPSSIEGYDCNIFAAYPGEKDPQRLYPRLPSVYVENRHVENLEEALKHASRFVEGCEALDRKVHEQARTETTQEMHKLIAQHTKPWWKLW